MLSALNNFEIYYDVLANQELEQSIQWQHRVLNWLAQCCAMYLDQRLVLKKGPNLKILNLQFKLLDKNNTIL